MSQLVPIWVTGEGSESGGWLFDALKRVRPTLQQIPLSTVLEDSRVIEDALIVASFRRIDDRTERIISRWKRDLGHGRLLVFSSEGGEPQQGVFAWKSVDETSLAYIVESEIEKIEMNARMDVAQTEKIAALQMSAELIGSMAHDLRAPLNSIIGFAQLLESEAAGPLNQKQSRYATNIATSGGALLNLIDEIVDLSKIDTGRVGLQMEFVELGSIVNDAIRLLREKAQKRGVALVLDSLPATGSTVFVDRRRFRQAIHLLLSYQLEGGGDGARLVVVVEEDANGPRLRMELHRNSDEMFMASETFAAFTQTTWQMRYVARVLEMHGAELVGSSSDTDGRRRVEVHLPPQSDMKPR